MNSKIVATRTETAPAEPEHHVTERADDLLALTRDEFMTLVNEAADLVLAELDLGDRDLDLLNLVVNTAGYLIDNPDAEADLDAVITDQYGIEPEELRGWWDWS
ncbi:hypothetical protein ABZW10_33170 [Kitasatospora sp. NPDC004723]|uniref:hypothetical protein n=1 Tax=Kitasatospora sp. NPDC004723 TaxID=3154288 RepID=UPI0033ADFFB7